MLVTLRFDLYASKRDLHLTACTAKRKTRFPSVCEGCAVPNPPQAEGSLAFLELQSVGILRRMDDEVLKQIFPGLKDDEIQTARENLDAYLELVWEIYGDMKAGTGAVDPDPREL